MTLAMLSNVSPSPLSQDLERWGYEIFEAVSLSEILHLCEHQNISAVIVNAGVKVFGIRQALSRQILIELTPATTTEELVSELTLLLGSSSRVQ
jgi:hypothetical protein